MSWSDDDLDFALRDLKDAELPLGATAAVRARVLAEVSKSARRSRWVWALAPVAAAALVLLAVVPFDTKPVAPPPLLAKAPAAPRLNSRPPVDAPAVMAKASKTQLKPAAGAQPVPAAPGDTQFVKLITDDPDVVILWAMNSKGAER
ncbi:hypothetical protein [Paludibaculum fermentans]|uniref:Uncharacterized protein n=1 Tax=Paludibaculum fermentans TaxID=1473598 RepID=A0A7S7NYU4_PALFE|nr:hypothetical protein [Paludibaculum fermentans]QOY91739.1 hypothetical protein IRI77_17895 [Paludibaculum fermentans]